MRYAADNRYSVRRRIDYSALYIVLRIAEDETYLYELMWSSVVCKLLRCQQLLYVCIIQC